MKTLKLNLLEKKEMNEVRGGYELNEHCILCNCGCYAANGQQYGPVYVRSGENLYQKGQASTHIFSNGPADK